MRNLIQYSTLKIVVVVMLVAFRQNAVAERQHRNCVYNLQSIGTALERMTTLAAVSVGTLCLLNAEARRLERECRRNQETIGAALEVYAADHACRYPRNPASQPVPSSPTFTLHKNAVLCVSSTYGDTKGSDPMRQSLITILLALVAAAVLIPACQRETARRQETQCKTNMKNIGTAMEMYSTDFAGRYPRPDHPSRYVGTASLRELTPNYLKTIPSCPAGDAYRIETSV